MPKGREKIKPEEKKRPIHKIKEKRIIKKIKHEQRLKEK